MFLEHLYDKKEIKDIFSKYTNWDGQNLQERVMSTK